MFEKYKGQLKNGKLLSRFLVIFAALMLILVFGVGMLAGPVDEAEARGYPSVSAINGSTAAFATPTKTTTISKTGPCGPRPCPPAAPPSANLGFTDLDKVFDIKPGNPGQPETYTFRVLCDPYKKQMPARDASIELPLYGSQKFISFTSDNPNWVLKDPTARTLQIDLGIVEPGETGTITIVATLPDDLNRPIMEQVLYANWNDEFMSHHKGFNLLLSLNVPPPTAGRGGSGSSQLPVLPTISPVSPGPTSGPFAQVGPPPEGKYITTQSWFLASTGHTLNGDFLSYWLEHGSVLVLGYPISELFTEAGSGLIVQYFERGVMEYHPENEPAYQILLKSLGRESNKLTPSTSPDFTPSPAPGSIFFEETGHWLDSRFVDYWQKNGGLEQFGFPIAEPRMEGDRWIQWTERARFEINTGTGFVPLTQLGLVGVEFARSNGLLPYNR